MDLDAFLAWEERQPTRYEFDGFQPVAMVGGTAAHATIQGNLITALFSRLRGKPCRPFGSELKVSVAGQIRYPDALVQCEPVQPGDTLALAPIVVFEILSKSSVHEDLVVKNAAYRATPSILRYVVLEQTNAGALVFTRKGEDWVAEAVAGDDAVLALPEIGIEIPLAECYADVELQIDELEDGKKRDYSL